MSDVVKLICETVVDCPPDDVLDAAKGETERCLILGWSKDGEFWLSGSFSNIAEIAYLLDVAKTEVMSWEGK